MSKTTQPHEQITSLLSKRTGRAQEAQILDILAQTPDALLSQTLDAIDLHRLLQALDDRLMGPDHQSAVLAMLSVERVHTLSVGTRARLIDALQKGRTGSRDERALVALITATTGPDLTRLKNAIDRGSDHRDLLQLVHSDIDDDERRKSILQHIQQHAPGHAASRRKVLSDIDDTLYANWKDKRFPKKCVYPGVVTWFRVLAREEYTDPPPSLATFLTARPQERTGLIEGISHKSLRRTPGLDEITVLSGSFKNLHSNAAIARKKLDNFLKYAELYPEYRFIFTGDSGQGDAVLASNMRSALPDRVPATFIHDVVNTSPEVRAERAQAGVHFFDTYAGASATAFELGLISANNLDTVVQATTAEMNAVTFDSKEQREIMLEALERDTTRARELL